MAFIPSRNRAVPQRASRSHPVLAVGQRVFVNCPGNRPVSIALGDESGKVLSTNYLADGAEVEVVAWRPRVAGEARYRVRALSNGADGWLAGESLRRVLVPLPAPEAPAPQAPVGDVDDGRRFGQRSRPERSYGSEAPTPAPSSSPAGDPRGRRFGQIN